MGALLLAIHPSLASSGYPAELEDYLALACRPPCTVCHESASGGTGTATREFAVALQERGLEGASDLELLRAAIDAMQSDGADSDGDDAPDLQELADGTDPNPGGSSFCAVPTPIYGCATAPSAELAAVLAGLAGLLRRRPAREGSGAAERSRGMNPRVGGRDSR